MIKIEVHRAKQIGGQITVVSTEKTKIIIDLGMNLPGEDVEDEYNNHESIANLTKGCDAIFYTHYHGDHIGLFHYVDRDIPQYIGDVARQVVVKKYETLLRIPNLDDQTRLSYQNGLENAQIMKTFHAAEHITVGDVKVTPFLVSHSAYDAYMFLLEAKGKRILHTGDFRGHGYFGEKIVDALKKYVGQVDVLTIEGTMLNREKDSEVMSERELSTRARNIINSNKYVFVHCSSTDLDRLASFKNAASDKRRVLVADDFQSKILKIFSDTAGKKSSCFDFGKVYSYNVGNKKLDNYMINCGFVMFVRATDKFNKFLDHLLPMLDAKQTKLIFSMWSGYIDLEKTLNKKYVELQNRFKDVIRLHTSGHAKKEMLLKICDVVNPTTAIIPIHREKDSDFSSIGLTNDMANKVVSSNTELNGIEIQFVS